MYSHILIPTDGSELAEQAVQHGIALAKALAAKITVLTVTPPFHTLTTDAQMIEDTPAAYKTRMQTHAKEILRTPRARRRPRASHARRSMSSMNILISPSSRVPGRNPVT